jgi:hypothetical protein
MATVGIDTTQYNRTAPQSTPLPQGLYQGVVVRVMQKTTNDQKGIYEEVEFDITAPAEFSNRKFWDRFNIKNDSADAQRIAREAFADLGKACGILGVIQDDQEILGREVQLEIGIEGSKNPKYPDPKNKCRKYWPLGIDVASAKKAAAPAAAAAAPAQKGNWGAAGAPAPVPAPAATSPVAGKPWGPK